MSFKYDELGRWSGMRTNMMNREEALSDCTHPHATINKRDPDGLGSDPLKPIKCPDCGNRLCRRCGRKCLSDA